MLELLPDTYPVSPAWTPPTHAELARDSLLYASSLANVSECSLPHHMPLRAALKGRQVGLHTGCACRHLPLDFPPRSPLIDDFYHYRRQAYSRTTDLAALWLTNPIIKAIRSYPGHYRRRPAS
jgi:hypothetical protein